MGRFTDMGSEELEDTKMKPDWEEEIKIALIKIESLHAEVEVGDFDATVTSFDKSRQVIRNLLAKQEEQHKAELQSQEAKRASSIAYIIDNDKKLIEKLKQQHRKELEGLKLQGIIEEAQPSILDRHEAIGYNMAVKELYEAITNLLEQKGK